MLDPIPDPSVSELLPLMRAASTSPEGPKWSRKGSADSDGEWGPSQSVRKSQRLRDSTPIDSGSESDFRPVVKEEIKIEVTSPRVRVQMHGAHLSLLFSCDVNKRE